MTPRGPVAYVLNAFPVISETFVLNEIRAMEAGGVPVLILTLSPGCGRRREGAAGELRSLSVAPPEVSLAGWAVMLRAHLLVAARHPIRYAAAARDDLLRPALGAIRARTPAGSRELAKRLRLFLLAGFLARAAGGHGAVHLHAHYAKDPLEVARRVSRMTGLPFSFAAHAKDLFTTPPERLARGLRASRLAVVCHGEGERYLTALALPGDEEKVLHVPHGIDRRLFHPRDGEREEGLILAVGRLTPKKGIDDLVAACARLRDEGRQLRCVVLGRGRERASLEAMIARHRLAGSFEIRDFVSHEALPEWYARASILAVPSKITAEGNKDGIPNVLMEAMACGLPAVATRVGGIPEIVASGETGLLVPPGDPVALAGALGQLLDDPALRLGMGRAAAASMKGRDFRGMAAPLVRRFQAITSAGAEPDLELVAQEAWKTGGLSSRAAAALGRRPRRIQQVERVIERGIVPGIRANAWRPDRRRLMLRRLWDEVFKLRRAERLVSLARASPGAGRILDLGCGRGGLSVALRARGHAVVALDLRARNCSVTRARGQRYSLDVPVLAAQAERLPFGDGTFDAVSCFEVLEHVGDPLALMREIQRVLTARGGCAMTVVNRWAHVDPHYHLAGVNFLPRALASRYVNWLGRGKRSSGDMQALEQMHYFTYRRFVATATALGFTVRDIEEPADITARRLHRLRRWTSLGFNTATVWLEARKETPPLARPAEDARQAELPRASA